eukprot:3087755-Amphidinium_carterae.1
MAAAMSQPSKATPLPQLILNPGGTIPGSAIQNLALDSTGYAQPQLTWYSTCWCYSGNNASTTSATT